MIAKMPQSTTVAFFGATGGVTNAILIHTLLAGYKATALVRTPAKLIKQLTEQGLDEVLVAKNLTIIEGNALDVAAVKGTLTARDDLPTHIVTGLGGSPSLQFDPCHPLHIAKLDNNNICETAAKTLVTALREIYVEKPHLAERKPLLMFVSTTGISRGPEDVPFGMRFMYHQMLAVPHADKKKMENVYRADNGAFRNVTGIRPTLLTGAVEYTDVVGLEKVSSGTEAKPARGFSIKRADVGHWVFENLINEEKRRPELEGEMVSLTS
ncbi:hypothetical protein EDD37DRAFT_632420 [Exophiala viscosa]|uniref:uncharacterized protein n=1 Tax=Exophiala viscosa TaxID=2486360 RepID=UPI002197CCE2|nr:hypothetical protein EDD37DRAFT_632420 [Exophiala viscosa]